MKRSILILGAGRSASSLVRYLVQHAKAENWTVTVADREPAQAQALIGDGKDVATAMALDATDAAARAELVAKHDLVISMLPAFMHMDVLKDCLRLGKNVITPSYVPDALWAMDADFKKAGLIVLNEMGLDPGIDHMSAMRVLHKIHDEGGKMEAFESYCGGLVAPESDDNPWHYKFSWNPRNVVLAGQGHAAQYIQDGALKYIPYHQLFRRYTPIDVPGAGRFEGYANRDSLKYREAYGIADIPTMLRGTLRQEGYCDAWDALVQLGCTEDGYKLEMPAESSWADYITAFLPKAVKGKDLRGRVATYLGLDAACAAMNKLEWLGLFGTGTIGATGLSPAATLQRLLEVKWKLGAKDKDMVVMAHNFRYRLENRVQEIRSSLVVIGEDPIHTAMAHTVGLPMAIATKLLLNGAIKDRGVLLPLKPELYYPILDELADLGIVFKEEESTVTA
ncbi:MAG: saccharopine dehydrogenase NADP-binding domain-containing protein [Flavobacteriales bacterium]|jgi:saccharopine dehydrogenase-like NADP-dependent oxidoreductase|nr:saccharopine dehydrogenase NADP-binding domain-containing protein [Flavobacteriales bacterium]